VAPSDDMGSLEVVSLTSGRFHMHWTRKYPELDNPRPSDDSYERAESWLTDQRFDHVSDRILGTLKKPEKIGSLWSDCVFDELRYLVAVGIELGKDPL